MKSQAKSTSTNSLELISYEIAKASNLTRFFTGVACKRGHIAERFVSTKACVVCARANQNNWNAKNTDKLTQYVAKYDEANREARRTKARLYRQTQPDKANAATKKYRQRNPDTVQTHCSLRRAGKLQATPEWADLKEIKQIYSNCIEVTKQTGVPHQVDHIVPLKHPAVCGLHVPANLQVITATENRRKRNHYVVG